MLLLSDHTHTVFRPHGSESWSQSEKLRINCIFKKVSSSMLAVAYRRHDTYLNAYGLVFYSKAVITHFYWSYKEHDYFFFCLFNSCSDPCYLPIVGVQGYCWTWSHSTTQKQSVGFSWRRDRPVAETSTCTTNIHKRQTVMSPAGFEAAVPTSERPDFYTSARPLYVINWSVL